MSSLALVSGEPEGEPTSLDHYLRGLRPILDDPTVTDLCINRPFEAFVLKDSGWQRVSLDFASLEWGWHLARLIATSTQQRISAETPSLSATLPSGERVAILIPPATKAGTVSITIRRPSTRVWSLAELADKGLFRRTRRVGSPDGDRSATSETQREEGERELLALHRSGQWEMFLRRAVHLKQNIIASGATGSGKTTLTKALILEIPEHERVITIEDAQELVLDRHPNAVRLFYSKDQQGLSKATPKQLLESTLRMRPDRVLLAELRSDEAYEYLRNINSGHPGSITSLHASSAELAFEQLVLLTLESPGGGVLGPVYLKRLLLNLVDVIVQLGHDGAERGVKEIYYDPDAKRR